MDATSPISRTCPDWLLSVFGDSDGWRTSVDSLPEAGTSCDATFALNLPPGHVLLQPQARKNVPALANCVHSPSILGGAVARLRGTVGFELRATPQTEQIGPALVGSGGFVVTLPVSRAPFRASAARNR